VCFLVNERKCLQKTSFRKSLAFKKTWLEKKCLLRISSLKKNRIFSQQTPIQMIKVKHFFFLCGVEEPRALPLACGSVAARPGLLSQRCRRPLRAAGRSRPGQGTALPDHQPRKAGTGTLPAEPRRIVGRISPGELVCSSPGSLPQSPAVGFTDANQRLS